MGVVIRGSCHCGAVSWEYDGRPDYLNSCNCSVCRRHRGLWAYGTTQTVRIHAAPAQTVPYVQGDRTLALHHCKTCGCITHWASLVPEDGVWRVAVNMAMAEPEVVAGLRVRHFDGADTWLYLD